MTASERLAEFVVSTSRGRCPDEAIQVVRRAALDTVGVMLAGAGEGAARAVRRRLRVEGGIPLCTVIGTALRTTVTGAALANGVAGHAHDFDDTNFTLMGHPSVPLFAAILASAEAEMLDGERAATAYVVGFEVAATLGAAVTSAHYERGWHATVSIGTLATTAAVAHLLGLDAAQTRTALGIAASLAGGVKQNFGSMVKPLHAGLAARNGVEAVLLAREGLSASRHALDGPQGYFAATGGAPELASALDGLGRRWQIITSGIAVKPYPSCALTHAAIDGLLELRDRYGVDPEHVEAIEVGVSRVTPNVLIHHTPGTALERKFSMEFCAASALADGRVDLRTFDEADAPSSVVEKLMSRVTMVVDPALPDRGDQHAWSRITVRLSDDRTLALPPRGARGHPDQPLSVEQLRAKFLGCAARAITAGEAEGVAEQLEHFDEIPDIRTLTGRLAAAGSSDDPG